MIKKAFIRRARMTGVSKRNRTPKGNIYFNQKWLGKKVAVVIYRDYIDTRREIKRLTTIIKNLKRVIK